MPRVIFTENAVEGLEHCRQFLAQKSPQAAQHAAQAINNQLELLAINPNIGRPLSNLPELRELIITFGNSGYVALYRYELETKTAYVLAFRHQKEVGY